MFQPLTHLEIEANHKDKGTLESIREAKVMTHYTSLHTEVSKGAIVFFISDMLRSVVQEEEQNKLLFEYIVTATLWLDLRTDIANFHLLFLLKLSSYLGFYPETSEIENTFFNLMNGTFEPIETNLYCRSGHSVELLKELLGTDFDGISNVKLNQQQRSDFLNMLLQYYELHLHGFKKPRSLAVLNSIFS